jgi:hypothetical protein
MKRISLVRIHLPHLVWTCKKYIYLKENIPFDLMRLAGGRKFWEENCSLIGMSINKIDNS